MTWLSPETRKPGWVRRSKTNQPFWHHEFTERREIRVDPNMAGCLGPLNHFAWDD